MAALVREDKNSHMNIRACRTDTTRSSVLCPMEWCGGHKFRSAAGRKRLGQVPDRSDSATGAEDARDGAWMSPVLRALALRYDRFWPILRDAALRAGSRNGSRRLT